MDFKIEKTLAEEFAGFLEEARQYGQAWVTFSAPENKISDNHWQAFTKKLDAFENAEINFPFTRATAINDLLPEIYKIIDQTPEQMQQSVNYYELKTQLADLGYNAPEVADQLREIVSQNDFDHAIVHTRQDSVKFEIEMERNSKGDFELLFNNALLDMGEEVYSHYFKPDVSADEAINFLRNEEKFHWPPDDEPNLDGPLDDDYIYELNYKLQNQNTMNTQNLNYLQKQLLNLGFGEGMNTDLEKHVEAKTPEFTLATTQEYNKQQVDYILHYKFSEKDDRQLFQPVRRFAPGQGHAANLLPQ